MLKDQMKMDTWYDLQSTNPAERWQGEIWLETQWIHNRTLFFKSLVKKLDQLLLADEQDKKNIKKHLSNVQSIFDKDESSVNRFERSYARTLDEMADNM